MSGLQFVLRAFVVGFLVLLAIRPKLAAVIGRWSLLLLVARVMLMPFAWLVCAAFKDKAVFNEYLFLPPLGKLSSETVNLDSYRSLFAAKQTKAEPGDTSSAMVQCSIGWALCDDITNAVVQHEAILDPKVYHTIKEVKNGAGAPPIRTDRGWLHIAHGVRNTAAGLRHVLYAFLCDLNDLSRVIRQPRGYLLAPERRRTRRRRLERRLLQRHRRPHRRPVLLYYASSDTRIHVATTTIAELLDSINGTPPDPLTSFGCVRHRLELIRRNAAYAR